MSTGHYFRAVAIDYDGTLADGGPPDRAVLAAIEDTRRGGRSIVLVTGRILGELRAVFPAVEGSFDAIVAENGAVTWMPGAGSRAAAAPVATELETALVARGVPLERGRVLLATDVAYDRTVLDEIARLGLELQLVRNRRALMVLPSGISKGTGLLEVLGELGISRHSTVAVGDAENDHSLVECCELGVAVANAIPSLQAHADVVLAQPDGAGVRALLRGALLRGEIRIQPKRWQVRLGSRSDGAPVVLPGSQINLLVAGGAASGKSRLAGLLVERLVTMGYSVCVIDPEGDHVGLGALRGVVVSPGDGRLPTDRELEQLLRRLFGSIVVDLSMHPEADRPQACRSLLQTLARMRRDSGVPHWIVLDEAHLVPDAMQLLAAGEGDVPSGVCLVTYRPSAIRPEALAQVDFVVATSLEDEVDECLAAAGLPVPAARPPAAAPGPVVLIDRSGVQWFVADERSSAHVRHWHKYLSAELPPHRRFFFRSGGGLTGASAASVAEFHHELERCEADVLHHHARSRDFSRWTGAVLKDHELADRMRELETRLAHQSGADAESVRRGLLTLIEDRYAGV